MWRRDRGTPLRLSANASVDRERGIHLSWQGASEGVWVRGSTDGGKTWDVLAVDLNGSDFHLPRHIVSADHVQLEVVSDDGFEHAVARIEGTLDLGERPPSVAIVRPTSGETVQRDQAVHLWGALLDPGTRVAEREEAVWAIDDREVGQGIEVWVAALEPGPHRISLSMKDAERISVHIVVR